MPARHPKIVIRIARVYEPLPARGKRYLIDRVWPRGVKKEDLGLTAWLKDVAPSDQLRKWFGHRPERWEEFKRRYRSELEAARRRWDFGADIVPSQTAAEARILRISDVERRRRP